MNKHFFVGTTGLTRQQIDELRVELEKLGAVYRQSSYDQFLLVLNEVEKDNEMPKNTRINKRYGKRDASRENKKRDIDRRKARKQKTERVEYEIDRE